LENSRDVALTVNGHLIFVTSPGFQGFESATGIDVSTAVAVHAERMFAAR